MDMIETVRTAVSALNANRFRSALMLIGMIIGVMAVIVVVAIGNAGQKKIEKELETFGVNSMWVWRDGDDRKFNYDGLNTSNNEITNEDVKVLASRDSLVRNVAPCYLTYTNVSVGKKTKEFRLLGTDRNFYYSNNESMSSGRFLNDLDVLKQRNVVVLSSGTKTDLFGADDAVGKTVRINGGVFTVIGVLVKKDRAFIETIQAAGGQMGQDVYIPISIVQGWNKTKNIMYFQATSASNNIPSTLDQVNEILMRRHHNKSKFAMEGMNKYFEISGRIMGILSFVLGVIAGISLLVGGLGIMNVMLISVTERTREIGIRKSVGATELDIILQFLVESVVISFAGGFVGISLGLLIISAIVILTGAGNIISFRPIFAAFSVSFIIGILAGIYPAIQAAKLDPIAALRYE